MPPPRAPPPMRPGFQCALVPVRPGFQMRPGSHAPWYPCALVSMPPPGWLPLALDCPVGAVPSGSGSLRLGCSCGGRVVCPPPLHCVHTRGRAPALPCCPGSPGRRRRCCCWLSTALRPSWGLRVSGTSETSDSSGVAAAPERSRSLNGVPQLVGAPAWANLEQLRPQFFFFFAQRPRLSGAFPAPHSRPSAAGGSGDARWGSGGLGSRFRGILRIRG